MSEALKDLGKMACDSHDHLVLSRQARNRGITIQKLVREIISAHVQRVIHDAKVVLGQDVDNGYAAESRGVSAEDHGRARSHAERHGGGRR